MNHPVRSRHAFTLVELLVVIGIIALLVGLLLPALYKARIAANTIQCAANMRTIMQGVHLYANAYKETFPGSPFTSGAHVRRPADLSTPSKAIHIPSGVTANSTNNNTIGVVSFWDWESPVAKIMGIKFNEGPTEADRRARYTDFLRPGSVFVCPQNSFVASAFGSDWGLLPTKSYTTTIDFMLRHNRTGTTASADGVGEFITRPEWNVPVGYVPKLSKVGSASRKVYLSEGSRFIDEVTLNTTYSSESESVQLGGAHSDQRMYVADDFNRSRVLQGYFGDRTRLRTANGGRLALAAFRHGTQKTNGTRTDYRMNLAFFDGHVETTTMIAALNPELHSPRGTRLHINSAQVYPIVYQTYFNNVQTTNYVCP